MTLFTNLRAASAFDQQSVVSPLAWQTVQTASRSRYFAAKLPGGRLLMNSALKSTPSIFARAVASQYRQLAEPLPELFYLEDEEFLLRLLAPQASFPRRDPLPTRANRLKKRGSR